MEGEDVYLYDDSEFFEPGENIGGGDEAQRRLVPFLNAARSTDSQVMCNNLAAKCAELQIEKEQIQRAKEQTEERMRIAAQKHEAELKEIAAQRDAARAKRDEWEEKCRKLEARMLAEESLYYGKHLGTRLSEATIKPPNGDETARSYAQYVDKRSKENLQPYFNAMDESETESTVVAKHSERVEVVQQTGSGTRYIQTVVDFGMVDVEDMMNQTQTVAANLTVYADRLFEYRTNVVSLYDQLKATAKFLAEVVRRVADEDDEQIQLLLEKIESLQLDIEQNNTIADQLMNDSKHVAEELSVLSTTMRTAAETSRQQPPVNAVFMAEWEENQKKVEQMALEKKNLLKKCEEALKNVHERDEELKNRAAIITDLRQMIAQTPQVDHQGIKMLVKKELSTIYEVMSAIPHK